MSSKYQCKKCFVYSDVIGNTITEQCTKHEDYGYEYEKCHDYPSGCRNCSARRDGHEDDDMQDKCANGFNEYGMALIPCPKVVLNIPI